MHRLYIVELIAVQAEILEFLGHLKAYISSTTVKEISLWWWWILRSDEKCLSASVQ